MVILKELETDIDKIKKRVKKLKPIFRTFPYWFAMVLFVIFAFIYEYKGHKLIGQNNLKLFYYLVYIVPIVIVLIFKIYGRNLTNAFFNRYKVVEDEFKKTGNFEKTYENLYDIRQYISSEDALYTYLIKMIDIMYKLKRYDESEIYALSTLDFVVDTIKGIPQNRKISIGKMDLSILNIYEIQTQISKIMKAKNEYNNYVIDEVPKNFVDKTKIIHKRQLKIDILTFLFAIINIGIVLALMYLKINYFKMMTYILFSFWILLRLKRIVDLHLTKKFVKLSNDVLSAFNVDGDLDNLYENYKGIEKEVTTFTSIFIFCTNLAVICNNKGLKEESEQYIIDSAIYVYYYKDKFENGDINEVKLIGDPKEKIREAIKYYSVYLN